MPLTTKQYAALIWFRSHGPSKLASVPPEHTSATVQSLIDGGLIEHTAGISRERIARGPDFYVISDKGFDAYYDRQLTSTSARY